MATERKWRRGDTTAHGTFTGADGEVTLDTTRYGAVAHDGVTAGGKYRWPTSKEIQDNAMVYAAVSGTDTLTWSVTPAPAAYTAGMGFLLKIANDNTGSATGNANSLGAKTFKKIASTGLANLEAGDFVAGGIYPVVYDGTYLVVTGGGLGGGAGAWKKIDSQTVSGVSSVDFAAKLDATYDTYILVGEKIVASTTLDLGVRVGTGGGPTYATAGYTNIRNILDSLGGTATANNGNSSTLFVGSITTDGPVAFEMWLDNANGTSVKKTARVVAQVPTASGHINHVIGAGIAGDATATSNALTSLRVFPSTGTISGVFTLYGLKRT